MEIWAYCKDENTKITIWKRTETYCIVNELYNCKKSRKSKSLIKYYNGKPYIMCCGHRYYLDKFRKFEL